jgi:phage gp46-like protein
VSRPPRGEALPRLGVRNIDEAARGARCALPVAATALRNPDLAVEDTVAEPQHRTGERRWWRSRVDPQAQVGGRLTGVLRLASTLEMFSRHHHQIVQRSQPIVKEAVHDQLRQLASQITPAQTLDIRMMLTWLCEWYDICHSRFGISPG